MDYQSTPLQGQARNTGFAAVPTEKGGQDPFGAYEIVSELAEADQPAARPRELDVGRRRMRVRGDAEPGVHPPARPAAEHPAAEGDQAAAARPEHRVPDRAAAVARCDVRQPPGALEVNGKVGDDSDVGVAGHRLPLVAHHQRRRCAGEHRRGSWTQWDKMFRRPHAIYISPYDPQKRVFVVDDYRHAVFIFSHDGKQLLKTLGEPNVHAADPKHFYRPTFIAWDPDGTYFIADGYANTRVVKYDKNDNYVTAWGEKGEGTAQKPETRPGLLQQRPRHRRRPGRARSVRQRSEQPPHPGVRRERQVPADVERRAAAVGRPPDHHGRLAQHLGGRPRHVEDGESGIARGTCSTWGTWGDFPGGMWGVHGLSIDSEGNFYTAEVDSGRAQKF